MRSKEICGIKSEFDCQLIPVGSSKFIYPHIKRRRFKYRIIEGNLEIYFNGNWEPVDSKYFYL